MTVCLLCLIAQVSVRFLCELIYPIHYCNILGNRVVHKQWKTHGNAVVNSNFVRLTPDRQSKKGALWSKKALGVSEFSAILKFRISGQGKNFFGDGIGLWMVQQGIINGICIHNCQMTLLSSFLCT